MVSNESADCSETKRGQHFFICGDDIVCVTECEGTSDEGDTEDSAADDAEELEASG